MVAPHRKVSDVSKLIDLRANCAQNKRCHVLLSHVRALLLLMFALYCFLGLTGRLGEDFFFGLLFFLVVLAMAGFS